jgi:hypothetical protein
MGGEDQVHNLIFEYRFGQEIFDALTGFFQMSQRKSL